MELYYKVIGFKNETTYHFLYFLALYTHYAHNMAKQPPHEAAGVEMHNPLTDQSIRLIYRSRTCRSLQCKKWCARMVLWGFHSRLPFTHLYSVVIASTRRCTDDCGHLHVNARRNLRRNLLGFLACERDRCEYLGNHTGRARLSFIPIDSPLLPRWPQ